MLGDVGGQVPIGVYDNSDVTGEVLSGLACWGMPGKEKILIFF